MENLQAKFSTEMCEEGRVKGYFTLTLLMRTFADDGETYFVAECLEIPGCAADGRTEEEAAENCNKAINACMSVIFEDCIKLAQAQVVERDFTGITSQRTLRAIIPELQYAV